AELVLGRRPGNDPELLEPAPLDPEVRDEVDSGPDDPERFTGDVHLGRRAPEEAADLDVIVLARGASGRALDGILRVSTPGEAQAHDEHSGYCCCTHDVS